MKRSKLFLGLTTCCLAVAGIVAAKANHFGPGPKAYYYTVAGNFCTVASSGCIYTPTGAFTCTTGPNSPYIHKNYYTQFVPLTRKCKNLLKYNEL